MPLRHDHGRPPPNKGRKLPAEVLTAEEVERLWAALPDPANKIGARNRAIMAMMLRLGMKVGQVVALERWHYEPGANVIELPSGGRLPLDRSTHESSTTGLPCGRH